MTLTLDEQIEYTKNELEAYKSNKYAADEIVNWLESIYESLCRLKNLEK